MLNYWGAEKEPVGLPLDQRVCYWCGLGGGEWEYVNGRRWYHKACIDLMDMLG